MARELVEQDHQRQRAFRRLDPVVATARGGVHVLVEEALAEAAVEMGILPHPAVVGHHLAPEIDEFGDAWIHGPHQSSARLTATLRPGRVSKPRLSSPAASPRTVAKCPLPKRRELPAVSRRTPHTPTENP